MGTEDGYSVGLLVGFEVGLLVNAFLVFSGVGDGEDGQGWLCGVGRATSGH